jgi:putative transposase
VRGEGFKIVFRNLWAHLFALRAQGVFLIIQHQLKLQFTKPQQEKVEHWISQLHKLYNKKLDQLFQSLVDPLLYDKIHLNKMRFQNSEAGLCEQIIVPSEAIQGTLLIVFDAFTRWRKKLAKKPRFKSWKKKPLSSINLISPLTHKQITDHKVKLPLLGEVKFRSAPIPEGKIKKKQILKKASGYYLTLYIEALPKKIPITGDEIVGIDPGYKTNLTLSNGEMIEKPKHFHRLSKRLAKAQKGKNKKLVARLHERIANSRKNDNHHISKYLVSKCKYIAYSKDNIQNMAKMFGKSVSEAGHYQLSRMIAYKAEVNGRQFEDISGSYTTCTCSKCLEKTGPTTFKGLKLRKWKCAICQAEHDRDVNAAAVTLLKATGAVSTTS